MRSWSKQITPSSREEYVVVWCIFRPLPHAPRLPLSHCRVGAAAKIVRHVSTSGGDAEYAVKRLVRGMCSSRESARQGFASCLAQVLVALSKGKVSVYVQFLVLAAFHYYCTHSCYQYHY